MTNFITAGDLSFDSSTPVILNAQKYLLPIPAMDSESTYQLSDALACAGGKGFSFYNYKYGYYVGAVTDGKHTIVIKQVTPTQAAELNSYVAGKPHPMDVAEMRDVLAYAYFALGLGNTNSYFSPSLKEMTQVGDTPNLFKRDEDICYAIRLTGDGEFYSPPENIWDPPTTPQKFNNGAVIVKQGRDISLVQNDVFVETYFQADGSSVKLTDVPAFVPKQSASPVTQNSMKVAATI